MILYIDPGTGSMLFTILIGLFGTAVYFFRNLIMKLKFRTKGKVEVEDKIPLVIFSDHKRYWNVFEPICDELEKREIDCVYMTESEDDPALSKEYKHIEARYIGTGNKAYAKMNMLKANVVLSTTPSLDVFQWKRSKEVDCYIHIAHAANDITLYKMFGLDYYDAILLSGEYQVDQIRTLEQLRRLPEKDLECVGIPYLDEMKKRFDAYDKKAKAKKESADKDSKKNQSKDTSGEKTVLLAPSWGDNGILKKYGTRFLDELVKTGYNIVIRPHPQSFTSEKEMIEELQKKYPESDKLSWNRDNDNFDILYKSDIMISDFSGVIFDYTLVFDKPVIYVPPEFDKSQYDAAWVDEELWTYEILPAIGKELSEKDFPNIKNVIDSCIDSEEYKVGRDKAREETWMYIGNGAVKTVDYIEKKLNKENDTNTSFYKHTTVAMA